MTDQKQTTITVQDTVGAFSRRARATRIVDIAQKQDRGLAIEAAVEAIAAQEAAILERFRESLVNRAGDSGTTRRFEDEDCDIAGAFGGNMDDAYWGGREDGEADAHRTTAHLLGTVIDVLRRVAGVKA